MNPNETLLRDNDQAMLRGDMDTFWAAYSDDVIVHIAGTNSLSGVTKGVDQLQALFGRFVERAGQWTFEPHEYFANDAHGVVLQKSHFDRDGKQLDTDDVFVCHFRDGRIAEFWLMSQNQAEFDAFIG